MQSLANYWRKHHPAVSVVIYHDDGLAVANEKIRQVFIGRHLSFTKGNTLTQTEFIIMGNMVAGKNPHQIAELLSMDIRSVYAYKQRIEKRMGGKINTLFIHSHPLSNEKAAFPMITNAKARLFICKDGVSIEDNSRAPVPAILYRNPAPSGSLPDRLRASLHRSGEQCVRSDAL